MGWDRHELLWDGMGWDRKKCPMDKPVIFHLPTFDLTVLLYLLILKVSCV